VSYNTNTRNKKIYNCFYCSAKIFFDEAVRSEVNSFIKEGRLCVLTDITNRVYVPPPRFVMSTEPGSIFLRPGEEKTVEIKVKSTTNDNSIVVFHTNKINDLQLPFTPNIISVAPYSTASSLLKIKALDNGVCCDIT
jgi:hypothetical protein